MNPIGAGDDNSLPGRNTNGPKPKRCRHRGVQRAPNANDGWLYCPACGRTWHYLRPNDYRLKPE